MGLLKVILVMGLIYYSLRIIFRNIAPLLLKKYFERITREMENRMQNNRYNYAGGSAQPEKEGTVVVDHAPKRSKNKDSNMGEYVDFEELKD